MKREVKLTYFKESGKYYSEGKYTSEKEHVFEIFAEVGEMMRTGTLPDLVVGSRGWYVLVLPLSDDGFPCLKIPIKHWPDCSVNHGSKECDMGPGCGEAVF